VRPGSSKDLGSGNFFCFIDFLSFLACYVPGVEDDMECRYEGYCAVAVVVSNLPLIVYNKRQWYSCDPMMV
jgi:hypothetical protein